jgi:hypothetical protein
MDDRKLESLVKLRDNIKYLENKRNEIDEILGEGVEVMLMKGAFLRGCSTVNIVINNGRVNEDNSSKMINIGVDSLKKYMRLERIVVDTRLFKLEEQFKNM